MRIDLKLTNHRTSQEFKMVANIQLLSNYMKTRKIIGKGEKLFITKPTSEVGKRMGLGKPDPADPAQMELGFAI